MSDDNKIYTLAVQMFGKRHPRYEAFTKAIPNTKNTEAIRFLVIQDWEAAAKIVDQYIADSGGAAAHRNGTFDKTIRSPIQDENDDTTSKKIYKIYARRTDVFSPFLDYVAELPHGKVRQKFLRLALVMGLEKEGAYETVRPMLSLRK